MLFKMCPKNRDCQKEHYLLWIKKCYTSMNPSSQQIISTSDLMFINLLLIATDFAYKTE